MSDETKITRVVDLRIPLPWLLTILGSGLFALVGMWFSVQQLTRDVSELKVLSRTGVDAATALSSETALLKYRIENVEKTLRLIKRE